MRTLFAGTAMLSLAVADPALGESEWVQSGRLAAGEIRALCERVGDLRLLARMQMISHGSARWLRLSRQEVAIEAAIMGISPLDPDRCYVIVRAGRDEERELRAFEVRDFAVSPERISVFTIGRDYDPPAR
jgi:hypothetical protein